MRKSVLLALAAALVWMNAGVFGQNPAEAGRRTYGKLGEWWTYGGDLASTRYSPLDQINKDNFKNLEVAWRFKTDFLGPRPDSCRGADSPRLPSFSLCIHINSPVPASSATTARRDPAVE